MADDLKDIDKFKERHKPESMPVLSGNSLMQIAIQKNYAPEFIEKMMALQERQEKNEAKKAFHVSMARFKANPPKIFRDMQVKYTVGGKPTKWSHADLATAAEAINKSLGENGLNSTWRTLPIEGGKVRVTCIIAHELGHSEETYLESLPDETGSKNKIQALGSAVFYLERYTLFALTGLAPARMDDDGKGAGQPAKMINDQQVADIGTLQKDAKISVAAFKARLKKKFSVDDVDLLTEPQAVSLIKSLEAIKNA